MALTRNEHARSCRALSLNKELLRLMLLYFTSKSLAWFGIPSSRLNDAWLEGRLAVVGYISLFNSWLIRLDQNSFLVSENWAGCSTYWPLALLLRSAHWESGKGRKSFNIIVDPTSSYWVTAAVATATASCGKESSTWQRLLLCFKLEHWKQIRTSQLLLTRSVDVRLTQQRQLLVSEGVQIWPSPTFAL